MQRVVQPGQLPSTQVSMTQVCPVRLISCQMPLAGSGGKPRLPIGPGMSPPRRRGYLEQERRGTPTPMKHRTLTPSTAASSRSGTPSSERSFGLSVRSRSCTPPSASPLGRCASPSFAPPTRQIARAPTATTTIWRPKNESKTLNVTSPMPKITVFAPGAGTYANRAVYEEMGRPGSAWKLETLGAARTCYDQYPPCFPQGTAGPNLESVVAQDTSMQQTFLRSDCLIFGSRGGQVSLPTLWRLFGDAVPPAVVLNGGCAMALPMAVSWPKTATTFLLLGGCDEFRGNATPSEHLATAKGRVPTENRSTAILYIQEMLHMPQTQLLRLALPLMLSALLSWKSSDSAPEQMLHELVAVLGRAGWTGQLSYKTASGTWQDVPLASLGPCPRRRVAARPATLNSTIVTSGRARNACRGGA